MSHFLIVGQKFSTVTNYIKSNGDNYTLLKDRLKAKDPSKRFKNQLLTDFSSKQNVLKAVDSLDKPVDGVLTTYENYVLPAAWIADYLGLPGLPTASAEACTDKFIMRSLFAKAPETISPDFAVVESIADVQSFANDHDFPLILKPANLAKSLLVTKNNDLEELTKNYHKSIELISGTYRKYAPNRQPKLIIEEFLEGSIHSVDAFVDGQGEPHVLEQVVDYQTGYDIGYDDNFHYSRLLPSALSAADQASLRHCAAVGIRALGMKNTPAHVEIIMTKNGPRIVEIGARNGGYRERMHSLANGIDIIGAAIDICQGKTPSISASKNDACAVLELFPKQPGIFTGILNQAQLEKLQSLNYLSIKATIGEFIGKSSDGYKMSAIVILHNADSEQFNKDLAFVNDFCSIQTKPR